MALGAGPILSGRAARGEPAGDEKPRAASKAYLIRVALPIQGSAEKQTRAKLDALTERIKREGGEQRPIVVLEFRPRADTEGEGSDFGAAYNLARHLTSEAFGNVRLIAWAPTPIRGHALLPLLACEELIVAPTGKLGDAGCDEKGGVSDTMRKAYTEIASKRRLAPPAFALALLDKQVELSKVKLSGGGERLVLADELAELRGKNQVDREWGLKGAGEAAGFVGSNLRTELGLASRLAADRGELLESLDLPPGALDEDPALGGVWKPLLVEIRGPLHRGEVQRIIRGVDEAMTNESINFICLSIDSHGGNIHDAADLADYLLRFDPATVRTVAFIRHEARADAALVALACDHVVVAENAMLGGSTRVFRPDDLEQVRNVAKFISQRKSRPWSLAAAAVDQQITVYKYTNPTNGKTRYLGEEEWKSLKDHDQWQRGDAEDTSRGYSGPRALDIGLVDFVADNLEQVRALHHVDADFQPLKSNWAHTLIAALASRRLAFILLGIGFVAMLIEFQSAGGTVLPGFVAVICFLLFFWSQFLNGTADWLEVILFVAGLVFLGIEVFVLPGFGIFGLGGGLMILASIILASQTFIIPRNSYQMETLTGTLTALVTVIGAVIVTLAVAHRFFPKSMSSGHLVLTPAAGQTLADLQRRESLVQWEHLVGKQGITTTVLRPAGKARIGDQLVDVMSEGSLIERGVTVSVLEVRGNCVVVRALSDPANG